MVRAQLWIVSTLAEWTTVRDLMHTTWAWPVAESLHFISLSTIVGTIVLFDARLLGVAKGIPIRVMHRLIPIGLASYAVSVATGALFFIAEPDQYVYNPSFHFKLAFMLLAGLNAGAFYLTSYRRVTAGNASADAPRLAKAIGALSLCLWIGVIVAGRLLTFYRPSPCGPEGTGIIAECIPGYGK
jgi:uncharacterized membrane protein